MAGQQIVVSARECRPTRGRSFAVGDRIMFRCDWWTVVGVFFASRSDGFEKVYILQNGGDTGEAGASETPEPTSLPVARGVSQ